MLCDPGPEIIPTHTQELERSIKTLVWGRAGGGLKANYYTWIGKYNTILEFPGMEGSTCNKHYLPNQRPLWGYDYFAWWNTWAEKMKYITRKDENILALLQK